MSEIGVPTKKAAKKLAEDNLAVCPECGQAYDAINVNSHKTSGDAASTRFYFQFLHDSEECIAQCLAKDLPAWLEQKD